MIFYFKLCQCTNLSQVEATNRVGRLYLHLYICFKLFDYSEISNIVLNTARFFSTFVGLITFVTCYSLNKNTVDEDEKNILKTLNINL